MSFKDLLHGHLVHGCCTEVEELPFGGFGVVHPPVGPKQWLGYGVEGGDGHQLHLTAPDREAWASAGKFL